MDQLEQFKANAKGSWVNGRIVGAYAPVDGFWAAISNRGEVEVFNTKKEASKWLKVQASTNSSDAIH